MKATLTFLLSLGFLIGTTAKGAEDPYSAPDDSWISFSGTVTSTEADSFMLDYGDGLITVEMDDWDMDADGYKLMEGDKVTVNGYVDDDLYDTRTIEASSVYVEDLNTYFYASATDEEDAPKPENPSETTKTPVQVGDFEMTGTVTSIAGRDFTIDTGQNQITVDTLGLDYNPMDEEGYQQVEEGDRVRVSGTFDKTLFENLELEADQIVTLADASRAE